MKEKSQRFLYGGIYETLNGKAAFMEKLMKIEPMREVIAKNLVENKELVEKLCIAKGKVGKGFFMHFELTENDLELIYDTLYEKNLEKMLETADLTQKLYIRPLQSSQLKCEIDVTCYVAYAIVMNPTCREKLSECVQERNEFYQYWENSEYHFWENEIYLSVEDIWDFRLLVGMVVKMREEESLGETYHLLHNIIYAGNRQWKRWLKGNDYICVSLLQEMMKDEVEQSNNMLLIRSKMILLFVMADDLEIPIRWDYEWMVQSQFYQDFSKRVLEHFVADDENINLVASLKSKHKEFLKKFDEKYASHCSLAQIALNPSEDDIGILLMNLMSLYQMHPRKFISCVMEEDECEALLNQCENWNQKKYRYLMMIANLCKYIQHLEKNYLMVCREKELLENWKKSQEVSVGGNQQMELLKVQYEKEINKMKLEKIKMEECISKQDIQTAKIKRRLEQTEARLQENMQELSALRSYVYLLSEKEEEFEQNPSEFEWKKWVEFLADEKVLVVGGHVNWQNKLKELFPKWQFITAKQGALVDNVINGRDVIVCNTMMLDHSCYYKVVSAMGRKQKLCYVHSNNMKKCLGEIVAQVK